MAKSFGEILNKTNKTGLDEVDVRYWIERYLFGLLGSEVRCPEVDNGKIVLISKSSTIRQELMLITKELEKVILIQLGHRINEVKIARFGG